MEHDLNKVYKNGWELRHIDYRHYDATSYYKICKAAIEQQPSALQYVREHHNFNEKAYQELCLVAVTKCSGMLQHIKEKDQTIEMCFVAVRDDWTTLRYVSIVEPTEYEMICIEAIKQNGMAIKYIKFGTHLTNDKYWNLCDMAVQQCGCSIKFIEKNDYLIYQELCRKAVKRDGMAIKFVPQNDELCDLAIRQNPISIVHMKPTRERCLYAVQQDGRILRYLKENKVDEMNEINYQELCLEAVKNHGWALQYVEEQTEELCLIAIRQSNKDIIKENEIHYYSLVYESSLRDLYGSVIQYVKNQTEQICLEAIRGDDRAFQFVIKPTLEMCLIAVSSTGINLKYIHPNRFSKSEYSLICTEAFKHCGFGISYVVPAYLDLKTYRSVCLMALNGNCELFNIDEKLQDDEEIWLAAVRKNKNMLYNIKNEIFRNKIKYMVNGTNIRVNAIDNLTVDEIIEV